MPLLTALDLRPVGPDRSFTIMFFTDGQPTVGDYVGHAAAVRQEGRVLLADDHQRRHRQRGQRVETVLGPGDPGEHRRDSGDAREGNPGG